MGTSPQIVAHRPPLDRGRYLLQRLRCGPRLPVAVLGNTVASDLGISPLRAVGQTIDVGGVQFQVIGVLAAQGGVGFASVDSDVIVPLGSIEGSLVAFRPDITQIRVQA